MPRTILYHGEQWDGSTALKRAQAFADLSDIKVVKSDSGHSVGKYGGLAARVCWKLRIPLDSNDENDAIERLAREHRPDFLIVDNSKVVRRGTLKKLRRLGVSRLAYYSPDDLKLKMSFQVWRSLPEWDIVFTTKTFNVKELSDLGVRRPTLVGKAYDPATDYPMSPEEIGQEFEAFDAVFIGAFEKERCDSINALDEAGVKVVVYGSEKGGWPRSRVRPSVDLRPSIFGREYRAAWHHAKIALCFLRKLSRDAITQRTMEIAAMGRPMLAEKTAEHDSHFVDGVEYVGFRDDADLVVQVRRVLKNDAQRKAIGAAARARCLASGYSAQDRARFMISAILDAK